MHRTLVQPHPFTPADFMGYAGVETENPVMASLHGEMLQGFGPGALVDLVADGDTLQAVVYGEHLLRTYSICVPVCLTGEQVLRQVTLPFTPAHLRGATLLVTETVTI